MALTIAAAGLLAGCGSSGKPAPSAPPATHPVAVASSSTSCASLAYTWGHSAGGLAGLAALATELGKTGNDFIAIGGALQNGTDPSAVLAAATADASQLGADSQADLANPPPSCIPGAVTPYRQAMAEASQSSQDALQAVNDVSSGNLNAAIPPIQAATTAIQSTTTNLTATNAAIQAFITANG